MANSIGTQFGILGLDEVGNGLAVGEDAVKAAAQLPKLVF